jgi:hypothetical protein
MEDYPPNTRITRESGVQKPTETPAPVASVIEPGQVRRRKKPLGVRLKETFIGGDAQSVMGYVMAEVVVPAIKDTLSDVVTQAVERMLFGEVRSSARRPRAGGQGGYVTYGSQSVVRQGQPTRPSLNPRARANHEFDQIILPDRPTADQVVDRMYDLLSRYEQVTVSNLYELVGITPDFTDNNWGWTSLEGTGVRRVREGFLIDIPRPESLRR